MRYGAHLHNWIFCSSESITHWKKERKEKEKERHCYFPSSGFVGVEWAILIRKENIKSSSWVLAKGEPVSVFPQGAILCDVQQLIIINNVITKINK